MRVVWLLRSQVHVVRAPLHVEGCKRAFYEASGVDRCSAFVDSVISCFGGFVWCCCFCTCKLVKPPDQAEHSDTTATSRLFKVNWKAHNCLEFIWKACRNS